MDGLLFEDASRWEAWLEQHHASSDGFWLRINVARVDALIRAP